MARNSPTVVERWLAGELRRLRTDAGLTQTEAAHAAGCSESYISILELRSNAKTRKRASEPMVTALLRAYGRDDLVKLFREQVRIAGQRLSWADAPGAPTGFSRYVGLEWGARASATYAPFVIPGVMQTGEYASRIIAAEPAVSGEHHTDQVELRARRQDVISRSDEPMELWAVIAEQALRRPIGSSDVMRDQYERLLELTEPPHIQLQVIPQSVGAHVGLRTPFTILEFDQDNDPGLIYIETDVRAFWFEAPAEIAEYQKIMNHLRAVARDPEESRTIIETLRKETTT